MKRGQVILLSGAFLISLGQWFRDLDSWLYPILALGGAGCLLYGAEQRRKEGTIPSGGDRNVTAYWWLLLFGLIVILGGLAFFSERRYWEQFYPLLMVWETILYRLLFGKKEQTIK